MAQSKVPRGLAAANGGTAAAWKTMTSWYLLTTKDHIVAPELQRFMSKRGGSKVHGRVCFRGNRRQGEVERRTKSAVAVGPDPAAMRFDDRLADCQSHAAALWFRRKERVEYLSSFALGQPGPRVIYGDPKVSIGKGPTVNLQYRPGMGRPTEGW